MKSINKNKHPFPKDIFHDNQSKIFQNIQPTFFVSFSHIENNRESARKAIVPANPLLKRRIPSFLRVYSQASSSNDILLQWHLFSQSELESFDAMMKKLYKDENLVRVQLYENYRALLSSALTSKISVKDDDDDNGITTTAL